MRAAIAALLVLLMLSACSQKSEPPTQAMRSRAAASATSDAPADKRGQFLAYEHSAQIETDEQKVAALHEAARNACQQDVQNQCVVLQSSVSTGRMASASLRVRAKPAGISQLIALLGKQGEIINQSTNAEDLARPLEDSAKRLAMLTDYRTRLEDLRGRASSSVEALIKVNKELAEVQAQIEAMTGERARLVQRVETELLNLSFSATQSTTFWRPVSAALSGFGASLSSGLAITITAVAYLIPFGILFVVVVWLLAKLWRRLRRPKAVT